jgi:hypothetical protein
MVCRFPAVALSIRHYCIHTIFEAPFDFRLLVQFLLVFLNCRPGVKAPVSSQTLRLDTVSLPVDREFPRRRSLAGASNIATASAAGHAPPLDASAEDRARYTRVISVLPLLVELLRPGGLLGKLNLV